MSETSQSNETFFDELSEDELDTIVGGVITNRTYHSHSFRNHTSTNNPIATHTGSLSQSSSGSIDNVVSIIAKGVQDTAMGTVETELGMAELQGIVMGVENFFGL